MSALTVNLRTPLLRLSDRDNSVVMATAVAIALSMAILAPLLALAGASVSDGYRILFDASFGSSYAVTSLLSVTTPLLVTALGVTLAYRAGTFNVGADGQIILGATAAMIVIPHLAGVPTLIALAAATLTAVLTSFVWGGVAGLLKKYRSVNEIISTIMLNMVALLAVRYLVSGPLKGDGLQYAATDSVPNSLQLGAVAVGGLEVPIGFMIAFALIVVMSVLLFYSGWGWRQRLAGINVHLAGRQRLKVSKVQAYSLAISGAFAGLAGLLELLGTQHRVGFDFSPGWGFDALAIALLAQGRVPALIPLALYFGVLHNGSVTLQSELGLSGNLVLLLVGVPVIAAAALLGYSRFAPKTKRAARSQGGTA